LLIGEHTMKSIIQRATRTTPFQKIIIRSSTYLTSSSSAVFANSSVITPKNPTTTGLEQIKKINYNKSLKVFMSSYDPSVPGTESNINEGGDNEGIKLYVGNLDWSTNEDRLREVFSDFGDVTEVFLPLNRETQRPRGFGFVTISSTEKSAQDIIEQMDATELDGRMIKVNEPLQRGPRVRTYEQSAEFNAAGLDDVKLYVGNLPFDTPEGEIINMFEQHGTVINCFFPTDRETGNFRGFAFVTMPAAEAQAACEQLNGRDVNGRNMRVNEAQPRGSRGGGGGYNSGGQGGYQGGYGGGGSGGNEGGYGGFSGNSGGYGGGGGSGYGY